MSDLPAAKATNTPSCAKPVLVVDDDGDLRETVGEVINDHTGHVVVAARNGTEALDFLLRPDVPLPCLIVLDLMMPVTNGWQVLDFLRTHDAWTTIPVAVVSASMNEQTLKAAHAARFLRKPIRLSSIVSLVRSICPAFRHEVDALEATYPGVMTTLI